MGTVPTDGPTGAARAWADLDQAWLVAFGQAWEALRSGNIAVGACIATPDGEILHAARNRVADSHGPAGEVFGTSLAHAEINVLARMPFRGRRDLVLTTTLEPCLQCAAAIRLGRVAVVRFAGADRYWDGCHEFGKLHPRELTWSQPRRSGPRHDELGLFATLITRFGPGLETRLERALREIGEGPIIDLALAIQGSGELSRLTAMEAGEAFEYLWPRLADISRLEPTAS
ncbi:MAG TPA: nucleoside deaminase [Trebonia sp.]|nr:nucleoside deaminase [Trebonia sp.]